MPLFPGTHIAGRFEIVAPIGAGSMGEVYKARDLTLNRDVALKLLAATLATSEEHLLRFEREARAASGLNHPHICTIYDVGHAPEGGYGSSSGQSVFTHGVEVGVGRNETHDLQTATQELIDGLAKGNPNLSRPTRFDRVTIGGRRGLRAMLSNLSDATRQPETIELVTTQLRDGNLFYIVAVAPKAEFQSYATVFDRVRGSIDLLDR